VFFLPLFEVSEGFFSDREFLRHSKRVIHRDIKAENLFISPLGSGGFSSSDDWLCHMGGSWWVILIFLAINRDFRAKIPVFLVYFPRGCPIQMTNETGDFPAMFDYNQLTPEIGGILRSVPERESKGSPGKRSSKQIQISWSHHLPISRVLDNEMSKLSPSDV